jgi:integrase
MNIKPVKHQTSGWCVVCPPGFEGEAKRKFRYFDTKTGASNFARIVNDWRHARRLPKFESDLTVTGPKMALLTMLEEGNIMSTQQLSEVLEHWKRTGSNAIVQVSLREAVERFIRHVETEERPRPAYLTDIMGKLNRFSAEFPGSQVHEFDRTEIRDYLRDWENSATRNQQLKRLGKFFHWARQERYLAIDPTTDIDFSKVDQSENISIYTVDEATRLMRTADTDHKSIAPWVALGLFGFMRSSEIQRLDWSAVDFDKGSITIAASIAKTGKRRLVELNDALRHWLEPYRQASGPIVAHLNGDVTKCFETANVKRLKNALRHSCVSYAAASGLKSLDEIFLQAGHTPSVALKHYIEGMTRAEALPYWQIRR